MEQMTILRKLVFLTEQLINRILSAISTSLYIRMYFRTIVALSALVAAPVLAYPTPFSIDAIFARQPTPSFQELATRALTCQVQAGVITKSSMTERACASQQWTGYTDPGSNVCKIPNGSSRSDKRGTCYYYERQQAPPPPGQAGNPDGSARLPPMQYQAPPPRQDQQPPRRGYQPPQQRGGQYYPPQQRGGQ